jgi:hypothetical protein
LFMLAYGGANVRVLYFPPVGAHVDLLPDHCHLLLHVVLPHSALSFSASNHQSPPFSRGAERRLDDHCRYYVFQNTIRLISSLLTHSSTSRHTYCPSGYLFVYVFIQSST